MDTSKLYKVAVIGDPSTVIGFEPFAFATFSVEQVREGSTLYHEALIAWQEALELKPAIIYVTEPISELLDSEINELASEVLPAVSIIPSVDSARKIGGIKLDRAIERALGTSLNKEED